VWLEKMMLEDINFSAAAHIYSSYFGDVPSFLPALRSNDSKSVASVSSRTMKNLFQPVHGTIIIPYHPLTKGITVRVRSGESIFAMDSGLVIEKENHVVHGHTIILQHANGLKSIYGGVLNSTRNKNEWVKGGEKLGIVHEGSEEGFGTLFIAMIVDNESIDPTEVISID
jgi:stage IV sporulation protein FA